MKTFIIFLVVMLLVGCAETPLPDALDRGSEPANSLPASFTVRIVGDGTTSGATRISQGNFTFRNDVLVAGVRQRTFGDIQGSRECEETWDGTQWVVGGPDNCSVDDLIMSKASIRRGVEQMIADGSIKPQGQCTRFDYCYTIS